MSQLELSRFNNQNKDHRYHKVWIAAMNPKEFQRMIRFENCELIPVPTICDEIALKLTEEANQSATELYAEKSMRSFLVASQLFIGLVYVQEQQVKFLYDLVSRCTLPTRFLIEHQAEKNVSNYDSEEDVMNDSTNRTSSKKALKRKSSTKVRRNIKRKISLNFDNSDEREDVETQNRQTQELLQNAFVANNADISLRESIDEPETNEVIGFDQMPQREDTVPEPCDFDNALLDDSVMAMTLDHSYDAGLPMNMHESVRQPNSVIGFNDTVYGQAKNNKITVNDGPEEVDGMDDCLNSVIDPIEMDVVDEDNALSENINVPSRKRKRNRRQKPFKDVTLTVNVKVNVITSSKTQRHLTAKEDSVSKTVCLNNLSGKLFQKPSHSIFTESMTRQFASRSMSDKLLESFKRMTVTKTEETTRYMVQEFFTDQQGGNEPIVLSMPSIENSIVDVAPPQGNDDTTLLPIAEFSVVDGFNSLPGSTNTSIDEQTSIPSIVNEIPNIHHQHEPVELSSAIRQILDTHGTSHPFTPCDTDSQQLFASRSRRNKLEWGIESVLQKLMSLWNSGVYPIGMSEIMRTNGYRMSAATAFFSVMELNSARIGLITIAKSTNSNVIFNITKSPKFIELQQTL